MVFKQEFRFSMDRFPVKNEGLFIFLYTGLNVLLTSFACHFIAVTFTNPKADIQTNSRYKIKYFIHGFLN